MERGFPSYAVFDVSAEMPDGLSLSIESETSSQVSIFAMVDSNRILTAETGHLTYSVTDAGIEIFASLTAGGRALPDGSVWAYLEKDTATAVELTFDGALFSGLIPVPQSLGVYLLTIAAAAQDGDLFFNRQVDLVIIIQE